MCNLVANLTRESFIGYKVAAKRYGRYYSIATRIRYPNNGPVPKPKHIRALKSGVSWTDPIAFFDPFLFKYNFFTKLYGRTAVFERLSDARALYQQANDPHRTESYIWSGITYPLVIIQVKLSDSLMFGFYEESRIVAGKHMEILSEKEVNHNDLRKMGS